MKKVILNLGLLLTVSLATVVFNSCKDDKDETKQEVINDDPRLISDVGVVINGVKWATRNVDAPGTFAAKPEDPGKFYQWNRKTAWPATGNVTGWDNTYSEGDTWAKNNDPSPEGWRVPTLDEFKTLFDTEKVAQRDTSMNSIKGQMFTDKITGDSLFLFLPAIGVRTPAVYMDIPAIDLQTSPGGRLSNAGTDGNYWSSTGLGAYSAYSGYSYWSHHTRNHGFSVRPVAE